MEHYRGHMPPQMAPPGQMPQSGDGMLHFGPDMLSQQQQQMPPSLPPQQLHTRHQQQDPMSSGMLRGMPQSGLPGGYGHSSSNPGMMPGQQQQQQQQPMGSSMNPTGSGSNLSIQQVQQLQAQIQAYKILARNQPVNDMVMHAVQGKRYSSQMSGGAPLTAGPPQVNFPSMSANSPASMMLNQSHRVASSTAVNSPGGSSTGVSSQVNSPAASLQPLGSASIESPVTPVTAGSNAAAPQSSTSSLHSELKAMNNSMAPNVSITSSNSPLPISVPPTTSTTTTSLPTSSSGQDTNQDTTSVSSSSSSPQAQQKQFAPPVKQVKITPYSKPVGIDPMMLLKERDVRYCVVKFVGCSSYFNLC